MTLLIRTALISFFLTLLSPAALAETDLDGLLAKIDADISAKRLSTPSNNNAIDKIWQFKAVAPYDQRINSRANEVGSIYVDLAHKQISAKRYTKAQSYLDNAWMLSYLTPGLESAQDNLDKVYNGGGKVAKKKVAKKVVAKKTVAKKTPKKVAKVNTKKNTAATKKAAAAKKSKLKKELAAQKKAEKKAQKLLAQQRRVAEEKERKLAMLRKEAETKRQAAAKLATLNAQRQRAESRTEQTVSSTSIAAYDLDQPLIDDREIRGIRSALTPICQDIIDNEASVVLHTLSKQDYRWLTVRLTLCVRRIDKGFRLRHSYEQITDGSPNISLHPYRSVSLLKQNRD